MAWQAPLSTTSAGVVVNLGTADDVFVGSNVTLVGTLNNTIDGTGSGHEALIYGTVVATVTKGIILGINSNVNSGQQISVKSGGHVQALATDREAVHIIAYNSQVANEGLISSPLGIGVRMDGANLSTQSRLVNSGTIEAENGVVRLGNEAFVFVNSGVVRASDLAYEGGDGVDQITNTGTLIGETHLGLGNDVYNGASGHAVGLIWGGSGNDTIRAGTGNDELYGGFDNDTLYGNAGHDEIHGDAGNDKLYGGAGNDLMRGWENNDRLNGDAGNDRLYGGTGNDRLYGDAGNDRLYGDSENDQLYGGAGNDQLYGGLGNNKLYGGAGNDHLYGGASAVDKLYGGAGTDRAYFEGNKNEYRIKTVGNKTTVTGPDANDELFDVEVLVFLNGNIVL